MSSHSPQRLRKSQAQPSSPGSMHSLPPRESSSSPFQDRPRTIKASSMPLIPSVNQIFVSAQGMQSSPTSSNPSRRSPPYQQSSQVQRLLPTPPQPIPPNLIEHSPERRMSPPSPPPQQQPQGVATHYPRPIPRVGPPQFLTKFGIEEPWQMTEELLAEIERADQQQSQGLSTVHHNYSGGYSKSDSPAKDPGVERVRTMDRSSPKATEPSQLGRRPSVKDSPKMRDRPAASPKTNSFPTQIHTPERRSSPSFNGGLPSPSEPQSNYRHQSPPVLRRPVNGSSNLATQTPPLQAINARTPDRSLPVQEEPEDEVPDTSKKQINPRDDADSDHYSRDLHGSPLPSSDVGGRNSRTGYRDGDRSLYDSSGKRSSTEEDGFTPRSNSVSLPDPIPVDSRHPSQLNGGSAQQTIRTTNRRSRNGSTDQLGLHTLDTSLFEEPNQESAEQPPQYVEPKRFIQPPPSVSSVSDSYAHAYAQQYADELASLMDHPTSSFIQAYLRSPRPDAPIPPTPHSQTSPPSPSPLLSAGLLDSSKDLPPFSPILPAGSPYPYPFSHVRRNQFSTQPVRQQAPNLDLNNPSAIHEQFVKQWQIYAQNHQGDITDSTLSPSSTPYPTPPYNPWAHWHTQRILGSRFPPDTATQRSSPSHEPVELPRPPQLGLKKKSSLVDLRARTSVRKPPPRVESTVPMDTSPEPSTSGEETAGEEHFAIGEEGDWVNGHRHAAAPSQAPTVEDANEDDEGEWIDEDWDDDDDDLLDLEYHHSYVNNIEKRRRRFETKWDTLMQAFQALDRQTDATMILLAAPSHSTKMHMAASRSIRRQSSLLALPAMSSLRTSFRRIAIQRKTIRSHKTSLVDRFLVASSSSGDGSDSSESREEDLKRALEAALGSLGVLGNMYEQREARWIEEMRRISEDRERVEILLRQALGTR